MNWQSMVDARLANGIRSKDDLDLLRFYEAQARMDGSREARLVWEREGQRWSREAVDREMGAAPAFLSVPPAHIEPAGWASGEGNDPGAGAAPISLFDEAA